MPKKKKKLNNLTWLEAQDLLHQVTERTAYTMLQKERTGCNRPSFVMRMYGRYSKLRRERELKELS